MNVLFYVNELLVFLCEFFIVFLELSDCCLQFKERSISMKVLFYCKLRKE